MREESLQKEGRSTAFRAPERRKGMRLQSEPGVSTSDIPGDHWQGQKPEYNELSSEQEFWKYTQEEQLSPRVWQGKDMVRREALGAPSLFRIAKAEPIYRLKKEETKQK